MLKAPCLGHSEVLSEIEIKSNPFLNICEPHFSPQMRCLKQAFTGYMPNMPI